MTDLITLEMLSVNIVPGISHFVSIQQDSNNPRVNYTMQTLFIPNVTSCFVDLFGNGNEDRNNPAELEVNHTKS